MVLAASAENLSRVRGNGEVQPLPRGHRRPRLHLVLRNSIQGETETGAGATRDHRSPPLDRSTSYVACSFCRLRIIQIPLSTRATMRTTIPHSLNAGTALLVVALEPDTCDTTV